MKYVVCMIEHLRDGEEHGCAFADTIEEALEVLNRDRFARDNHEFAVFELGKRVDIEIKTELTPQAPIARTVYKRAKR